MATVNSVPNAICNIPLTGIAPPRVLMCSASMGAEGSVTLQLREAVQAPDSNNSLDTALTIGYPDPEMLADVLGTLQAAALNNNNNSSSLVTSNNNPSCTTTVNGKLQNNISTRISNSSSSGGNSNSSSSNSNNNINNINNNNNNNTICNQINNNINCSSSGNSNSSTTSSSSNVSENSGNSVTVSQNPIIVVRKPRPKTSSPTRHGPQQCQVCSKIFGNASALAKHKLTHSDERKYVCAMCSKAFKRQDHLNGHMLTHRNKKPYECKAEGCGKSYCDARSLRRHTENHHSTLAMTATTPSNQSLSPSTGPPTGLSLSPATASGDASSPHGATCVQYISNCGDGGNNSKPSSPSSPAGSGNEGLTRQQLDLISQIMQQTKQASAQVTVSTNHNGLKHQQHQQNQQQLLQQQQQQSQRPRTWNMQTQLQQTQTKSPNSLENFTTLNGATITSGGITINGANITSSGAITSTTLSNQQQNQQQNHQNQTVIQQNQIGQTINIVKIEQKPVECNLCHRKFKNVPALNGHMRLHGGYFKKENETKKCEKKESIGPPLQTASIGVRALIEEKIISKRTKDLKGAFVVPAPPLTTTRRISDIENFLTPKTPGTPSLQTITLQQQNQSNLSSSSSSTGTVSTTTTNNNNGQLATTIGSTTLQLNQKQTIQKITNISTISQGTSTDSKDATLIELLKRGTKVAVKRTCSDTGQLFSTTGTVILPSDHHQSLSSPNTPNPTPPLSISLQNGETTPLALTISQAPNGTGDVYTLTYSTDSTSTYFGDNDVYSVSDTAMLLQAVDSMQLLNDSATNQLVDDTATINDYTLKDNNNSTQITKSNLTNNNNNNINNNNNNDGRQEFTPTSKQLQDVLNSPLPDNLAEFGTFHSKDFILYNCGGNNTQNTITSSPSQSTSIQSSSVSPLPSPLAYPTPPASHEAVTESSPFLDDSHHFPDASAFFDDKTTVNFIHDNSDHHQFFKDTTVINDDCNLTENEKILKLKNELFNDSKSVFVNNEHHEFFKCNDNSSDDVFDNQVKVEDLLNENSGEECDLKDFNDQNLSFLDEPQNFLDDSRNPSSPLSESFFTSGIGTAEEVKEVLKDVLPNENLTCDNQCENDIDLYYLPGLTLQSQMMPNSDDPLLSSSPKDFGHNRILLQQQQNQQQQQQQLQIQKFDPVQFFSNNNNNNNNNTTNIKRPRTNDNIFINNSNINGITAGSNTAIHTNINGALTMTVQSLHHQQQHQIQEQQYIQQQQQQQKDNNNTTVDSFINPTLPTIINISSTNGCHQSRINNFINNETIQQPTSPPPPQPQPLAIQQCSSSVTSFVSVTSHHTTPTSTTQITSSILKRRLRQGSTNNNNNNFIPKKHEIYRSKLRKPSTTHYTPSPLLNPDRKASGLYTNLPKSLLQDTISFGDEFDDTASLVAFLDDSKVNIGTAYQATIPPILIDNNIDNINNLLIIKNNDSTINNNNNNYDNNDDDDELMWDPKMISKSLNDDEKSLIRFIELSKSSAVPLGFHSEEVALKALLQAQGDTHIAVLNLLQSPSNSVHLKWTGTEVEIFLKGLEKYGKDFYRISAEITTKTTSDCIQLYYFWKKLCIDYKTTHLKQDSYDATGNDNHNNHHNQNNTSHSEPRPHVCEMPDCSASFTSKAALHGHIRIHCIGKNNIVNGMSISSANGNCNGNGGTSSTTGNTTIQNGITNTSNCNIFTFPANNSNNNTTVQNSNNKDDFPCKVCGKVFNKVKSRSAHMKSHRPQDNDQLAQNNNNNNINNLNNNQQTIILTSN